MLQLEELRDRGWVGVDAHVTSTLANKQYCRRGIDNRRDYVEVFLKFDDLPHVQQLPSDQVHAFYQCPLQGYEVPAGRKAAWYQAVLANGGALPDDVPERGGPIVCPPPAAVAPAPLQDADIVQGDDEVLENDEDDASSSTSSSSSSSSSQRGACEADDDEVVHPGDEERWPAFIEGCRVRVERRAEHHRLIVRCPHHANCTKRRNIGPPRRMQLGRREPVAFLGAWLSLGHNHGQGCHPNPTSPEMRAWLDANPDV